MRTIHLFLFSLCLISGRAFSQQTTSADAVLPQLENRVNDLRYEFDMLKKQSDDILWYNRVGDIAWIDKVFIAGPPPRVVRNPNATGANNPLKFWTYVFIPRNIDPGRKYPLIVLPHGGVHGDFTTYYTHIIRELMFQGYVVVAPEYRGSTGYGKSFQQKIDYGGLEVEDAHAARNYMIENYPFVDKNQVGIVGWSHGGLIGLLASFEHPDDYQAVFAGVPVSDLVARMGYHDESYRKLFSAEYHIGETAAENTAEYRRRSPAWNAHKQKVPLRIHTTTNDDDVNVLEVEHLIKSLKAEGKTFEYEIFQDAVGGHSFDRIDTRSARLIRLKIYEFLAKYLNPPVRLKSVEELSRAAYFPPTPQN